MTNVKIIGAGSIGNHLSNAARSLGWNVTLCDIDEKALERTKNDIYPSRYGSWDENITLALSGEASKGGFDYIFIGTPPDSHVQLALSAVEERPKAILVEKPFATPSLENCQTLFEEAQKNNVALFTGYDHVVAESTNLVSKWLKNNKGDVITIDVSFREHWQGIFNAHPWLDGPADTYLGYWKRGGGACGEHSHALNLWQHFAHSVDAGKVVKVSAELDYVNDGKAEYDRIAALNLTTESGLMGRVIQDVVTRPVLKWARIQAHKSAIEWQCQPSPYADIVKEFNEQSKTNETKIDKKRPDDFIQELKHIENALKNNRFSPISGERGLDSMLVIAAAHLSAQRNQAVYIDYSKGYTNDALVTEDNKERLKRAV